MDKDKYIKPFRIFVTVALVMSVSMNFTLLSRLDQVEYQMNVLTSNQHNLTNEVNGQTNHIQNVMNDIMKEQSWISAINMDVNTKELEGGQAEATFEWQVKELQSDSEVVFNYLYGDSEEYTALKAEELQQGLFQVKVPFEVDLEPQWEVGLSTSNSNSQQESEEKWVEEQKQQKNTLKYFVSVSYDDTLKSGEIHTEQLGYFESSNYGFLQTDIDMFNENFSVTLTKHKVNDSPVVLEGAYLLKYEDGTLIGEEELELDNQHNPPDDRVRFFHLNQVEQYEEMRLGIKVVYSNGKTFEKIVYE
ncbi:hypothetical protein [Bacillus solitudinis]|uniref:hypothetical protein n=1 Tax=Bacillus solitudinis TaxID=2014074 RepID=UPI000C2357F2|nr:hypothetical protein [Bacillus solitudinis]